MEYQKNIATNVYHGFGAVIALIITYVMEIKIKTGLIEDTWFMKSMVILAVCVFIYHVISMKKPK